MNKKFFSLIYGDQVHIAPKTKIVPADSFSKLIEASEVLEHIKKDAERYRNEVVQECEKLKEAAEQAGYEEGFKKWAEHVVNLEQEIEKVHREVQQLILPVALKAAKKIVAKELELSNIAIVDIIVANLKAVSQHKKITIYVNKNDLDVVEKNRPRLKETFESLESLSIRERSDVAAGGCIIETEIGIINAQLEHRWKVLEKAFEALLKQTSPKIVNTPTETNPSS